MKGSKELIAAVHADYKALKADGKEGEENLHHHGYLNGWGEGFVDGKAFAFNLAYEIVHEMGFDGVADTIRSLIPKED